MKIETGRVIRHIVFNLLAFSIIAMGCTPRTDFKLQSAHSTGITLEHLLNNRTDYFIHYNTRIVVFDPITDAHTIQVGERWVLIEDLKDLSAIFSRLELSPRFDPDEVYQVVDSLGTLYGYMVYASGDLVSFQKVDDTALRIYYQPQRPPDAP